MAGRAMAIALKARAAKDVTILFWNNRGAVCCARHAPYPGTDTWRWQRWMVMPDEAKAVWQAEVGAPAKCECCR